MQGSHDLQVTVAALRAAIPYLRLYQGRVFVIKAGGGAFSTPESTQRIVEQLGVLHQVGIRVVVVHGGGPQTSETARKLGLEPELVEGRRVTCDRTLEVSAMVLAGKVSSELVAGCRAAGIPAVGLSGVDGGLVTARRRPPRTLSSGDTVDYGHVGDIQVVEPRLLNRLLDDGFLPIVSPLSADEQGRLLNVNADVVAAALAARLGALKLILLTDAEGIRAQPDDPASLVSYTDLAGLERLEAEGSLAGGMLPKAAAIRAALTGGVPRAHVISFRKRDSLLLEVFTNEGAGTLVVRDTSELLPQETHLTEGAT